MKYYTNTKVCINKAQQSKIVHLHTSSGSSSSTSEGFPSFFNCFFCWAIWSPWQHHMYTINLHINIINMNKDTESKSVLMFLSPCAPHTPSLHEWHLKLSSSARVPAASYRPYQPLCAHGRTSTNTHTHVWWISIESNFKNDKVTQQQCETMREYKRLGSKVNLWWNKPHISIALFRHEHKLVFFAILKI